MNPDNAGRVDSRRISRHNKTSAATPSADPIAGNKPERLETATKVTTGSDE
jgi:hypothetical protein